MVLKLKCFNEVIFIERLQQMFIIFYMPLMLLNLLSALFFELRKIGRELTHSIKYILYILKYILHISGNGTFQPHIFPIF